ncbi:MAG: hypothetical protein ACYTF6_11550, partial [Planctomycetota bacterium]
SSQEHIYKVFRGAKGEHGRPTYAEAAGRIGTVVDVKLEELNEREKELRVWLPEDLRPKDSYCVALKMDDNGQIYTASTYDKSIRSIAPVADTEKARALWKGKTLWTTGQELNTYDPKTEKFGKVKGSKYAPVKVIDVVPGWWASKPVWFILETASGERGFLACQLSGTNAPDKSWARWEFAKYFYLEDPRKLFPWNEKTWSAIKGGRVFVGMRSEQARLSWGEPEKINRTTTAQGTREQWVYDRDQCLYFENGVLTAIQN